MSNSIHSTGYRDPASSLASREVTGRNSSPGGRGQDAPGSNGYQDQVEINSSARDIQTNAGAPVRPTQEIATETQAMERLKAISQNILGNSGAALSSQANSTPGTAFNLLSETV